MANSNIAYSILWLIVLWCIAWPIAGFAAGFWILIQPFEACFPFLKSLQDFLEKLVTWPRQLGEAIANAQTTFPAPM